MKTISAVFLILCAMLALTPRDAHAIAGLRVKCDQEGAEVFLNGKMVGVCPLKETFKAGSYTVEVRKNLSDKSYYYYKSPITLPDGVPVTVDAVLERVYPEEYWYRKAVATRFISDWDEYLRRYPNGSHSAEVHQILENYFYETAGSSGGKGDWQEYLRRYAGWSHGDEARQQVARLQQEENEQCPGGAGTVGADGAGAAGAAGKRANGERTTDERSGSDGNGCRTWRLLPDGRYLQW